MPIKDVEANRKYQREYQKKWRARNLEKARAIGQAHEEKYREERRAKKRAHYEANAESIRAKQKEKYDPVKAHESYLVNKEKVCARSKARREADPEAHRARTKKWFEENKERKHELDKLWREANKDRIEKIRKERHWKLKHEVWDGYGGAKCVCCGESRREFLTIDHIDGGGNKHRKELRANGSQHIYQWLKKNNFPPGYRVLCMNCNFAAGMYGKCPHEVEHASQQLEGEQHATDQ